MKPLENDYLRCFEEFRNLMKYEMTVEKEDWPIEKLAAALEETKNMQRQVQDSIPLRLQVSCFLVDNSKVLDFIVDRLRKY